ncbi:hypothetical protein Y032_0002g912 [Ancylostoma ceylanicum]|uniref:Uncharacterized protein n=1 Tax=Ancylostoma ceylanicum TaxID=53326 RepID=A0A016W1X9_9BILA|nr:hypothetical protein Y032_0002g912 [Ancylostoma ceylanicum]
MGLPFGSFAKALNRHAGHLECHEHPTARRPKVSTFPYVDYSPLHRLFFYPYPLYPYPFLMIDSVLNNF